MNDKVSYDPNKKPIKNPSSLGGLLEAAVLHHQHGRFEQAKKIYDELIQAYPMHPDAWHLLGVLALQAKQYAKSQELITKAIELSPQTAQYHYNLAMSYQAQQHWDKAIEAFKQARVLQPDYYDAIYQMGITEALRGHFEAAVSWFQQAAKLKDQPLDALFQLAQAYRQLGEFHKSIEIFIQLLAIKSDSVEILLNLGYTQKLAGDLAEAIHSYDQALSLAPKEPMIYNMRGVVLVDQGEVGAAIKDYQYALKLKPDFAEVYNNLGIALFEMGKSEEGLEAFGRALQLQKEMIQPYINLATAYEKLNNFAAALSYYDQAIKLEPRNSELYFFKGVSLYKAQQFDAAIENFNAILSGQLSNPNYLTARGAAFYELAQFVQARQDYESALALDPGHATANTNLAFLELLHGDLLEGFARYEWRWLRPDCLGKRPQFQVPEWTGQVPLTDKTLLIFTEQGFGDTLQMLRYLEKAQALASKLILQVDKTLVKLLKHNLPAKVQVVSLQESLPHFDYFCSLQSLPFRFMTSLESIPAKQSYLASNLQRHSYWELQLGVKKQKRIGLVWHTHSIHPVDAKRCISLDQLLQVLAPSHSYFCLQKEISAEDKAMLATSSIKQFCEKLTDFSETAALCDCMDLIITIDTSVAHLAGALGKPVWLLLPLVPDWRWLLEREDSPWYPSLRLFRQQQRGEWSSVLAAVKLQLEQFK